jgi:hypothetical protein
MSRRGMLLVLALLGTLIAVYFAPAEEGGVVPAAPRAPAADAASRIAPAPADGRAATKTMRVFELRSRDDVSDDDSGLFAAQSWEPVAARVEAPVQAPVEPAAPQAPPIPLQLLGRYQEEGRTAMFATFNGDSVVLWPGQNINSEWRVDAIESGQVVLTYLPLGQKQSLPWTATQ